MSEYTAKKLINAPADEVFSYVTDVSRMPEYLPTVHEAVPEGPERVRIIGEAAGHPYDVDGWFQVHEFGRTMLWGSDGEHHYSGDLEVMDQGSSCFLTVNIKFEPTAGMDEAFNKSFGSREEAIHQSLDAALESVKNACERAAAKVPTPADSNRGYMI